MKSCTHPFCKQQNPQSLSAFNRGGKRTKDGLTNYCKSCSSQLTAAWRKANPVQASIAVKAWAVANPEKKRLIGLRKFWPGATLEQVDRNYQLLLTLQAGRCAVCEKPEIAIDRKTGQARRLAVDHDHATGRVRGLLCSKCNVALGGFSDSPVLLRNAFQYLIKER